MTIQQLKYMICVANTKSMNKAANELFVSQPCLSNTIRDLEEEIHTTLFIRSNRGIVLTAEGEEFLVYARQMVELEQMIEERYMNEKKVKKKFSVSMQHYSFAVDAFITLVKENEMNNLAFAVHETKTDEVIKNVKNHRSELGILYINDFNKKVLQRIFSENGLEYFPLFQCGIYVFLSKTHPLAENKIICLDDLLEYPYLSFEQGDKNSFYFAEEVFSTYDYKKVIKADDRATMLNLMIGLNGYTTCSGIISENLNGDPYKAIPLETDEIMQIGYIKRKKTVLSPLGKRYIEILKTFEKKAYRNPGDKENSKEELQ